MTDAGKATQRRPFTAWILILLIFTLGIGAIISGAMLFLAPDGRLMQMATDMLEGSPFSDFLIPGIILFVFLGIYPLLTGVGLLKALMAGNEHNQSVQESSLGMDSFTGYGDYVINLDYYRDAVIRICKFFAAGYGRMGHPDYTPDVASCRQQIFPASVLSRSSSDFYTVISP